MKCNVSTISLPGAARTQSRLPKIARPNQPLFAEVADVSSPEYNGQPPTERAPSLIKASQAPRAARTQPQLPKIMHPKQPQFADVANVNPSLCNERSLLGGASLLIKAYPSARSLMIYNYT